MVCMCDGCFVVPANGKEVYIFVGFRLGKDLIFFSKKHQQFRTYTYSEIASSKEIVFFLRNNRIRLKCNESDLLFCQCVKLLFFIPLYNINCIFSLNFVCRALCVSVGESWERFSRHIPKKRCLCPISQRATDDIELLCAAPSYTLTRTHSVSVNIFYTRTYVYFLPHRHHLFSLFCVVLTVAGKS